MSNNQEPSNQPAVSSATGDVYWSNYQLHFSNMLVSMEFSDLVLRAAVLSGGKRQLAESLGVSPDCVRKWIQGRVPASVAAYQKMISGDLLEKISSAQADEKTGISARSTKKTK